MTMHNIELTEDMFAEQYPLRCNHLNPHAAWGDEQGGCLFETYGEELEFVRQQDPRTVWTFIDGEDGDLYSKKGTRKGATAGNTLKGLLSAKKFIEEVGGIEAAKEALQTLEELR